MWKHYEVVMSAHYHKSVPVLMPTKLLEVIVGHALVAISVSRPKFITLTNKRVMRSE